jgi:hypothetical protein
LTGFALNIEKQLANSLAYNLNPLPAAEKIALQALAFRKYKRFGFCPSS